MTEPTLLSLCREFLPYLKEDYPGEPRERWQRVVDELHKRRAELTDSRDRLNALLRMIEIQEEAKR